MSTKDQLDLAAMMAESMGYAASPDELAFIANGGRLNNKTVFDPSKPSVREQKAEIVRSGKKVKGGNFLAQSYNIFATPYFRVFIQGVKDLPNIDTLTEKDIETFLPFATVARIGYRGIMNTELEAIREDFINTNGHLKLYVDREYHKSLLIRLTNAGAKLDKNKVANRAWTETTLSNYLNNLSQFLVERGCRTPAEYLGSKPNNTELILNAEDWDKLL